MDEAKETPVTEYLKALFRELERLFPTCSATSHWHCLGRRVRTSGAALQYWRSCISLCFGATIDEMILQHSSKENMTKVEILKLRSKEPAWINVGRPKQDVPKTAFSRGSYLVWSLVTVSRSNATAHQFGHLFGERNDFGRSRIG
jgi:hypothetical protein